MTDLWATLADLKSRTWVDLTHSLTNDSPVWSGIPADAVNLGAVVFDWGNPMLEAQIQKFSFPGQFGTHVDFPGHFIQGREGANAFSPVDAVLPLCVIDVTKQVADNQRYAITVADIKEWEDHNGAVPDGSFVALRTGWSHFWPDIDALQGSEPDGSENFPGWSLEAIQYLIDERDVAAVGHETMDTDASAVAEEKGDLVCERYVLNAGKFQVELLDNLDELPETGALILISWPRIECANGLPARVLAVY